jgi:hypothetical protein
MNLLNEKSTYVSDNQANNVIDADQISFSRFAFAMASGLAVDLQLRIDILDMRFCSLLRDKQFLGDLCVRFFPQRSTAVSLSRVL